jgi:hypothetical protein
MQANYSLAAAQPMKLQARDDSHHGGTTIIPIDHAGELQFGRGSANEVVSAHLPRLFSHKNSLSAVYNRTQSYSPLMWGLISLCSATAFIYAVLSNRSHGLLLETASMSIK